MTCHNRYPWCVIVYLLLALCCPVSAAEPVIVRTSVEPVNPVWVGQRVSVFVQILTRVELEGTPRFDIPDLDSAIFLKFPGSPLIGSETIDGQVYVTRRYEFLLYPRKEGVLTVPAIGLRLTTLEAEVTKEQTLASGDLEVVVKRPAGALPGQVLITSSRVDVKQTWSLPDGDIQVGAAIKRTIRAEASDILGIALAPVPADDMGGLKLYRSDPSIDESVNRGELVGSRSETLTYICVRPGTYSLPTLVYTWWDPVDDQIKKVQLPGKEITVVLTTALGPANGNPVGSLEAVGLSTRMKVVLAGIGAVLVIVLILAWRRLRGPVRSWWKRQEQTEPAKFRRCLEACRGNQPHAAYSAYTSWNKCVQEKIAKTPGIKQQIHDEDLNAAIVELQYTIVEQRGDWTGDDLARALLAARRARRQQCILHIGQLCPLNH